MLKRSAIMGVVAMAMKDSYEAGGGVWAIEVCRSAIFTCTTRRRKGHFAKESIKNVTVMRVTGRR